MNNDQDKSFEKKLQSLSAGFELTPAADSWNKIEAQLPIKKKRRFIFFLIPVGIVMLLAGVFVFNNNPVINDSSSIQKGHPVPIAIGRSRRSAEGVSSSTSNSQSDAKNLETNIKTNNADISNQSIENKNASVIAATGNSFSLTGISIKNNRSKKYKSPLYNNASNDLTDVKNNGQSIAESSTSSNENEIRELAKMLLINPTLMTNNNQSPVEINFQQTLQTKKSSHWSVGVTYLPMFTNRKVSYDLQNSNPSFIDDTTYKKKDEYLFKNNFGLDVYYSISKKFYLHSGLYAMTFGEKIFYDNIVYQNTTIGPITTADFADYIAPGSNKEHINKYSFIQVPVSAGLNIRTGAKTSLNVETGFAYGYLVKTNALEYINVNDSLHLHVLDEALLIRMNRNQFFATASICFDWFVLKNISWRNGAMAQYQLTDLYRKDEIQSQHNYGFGLHTSLIYHFK